MLGLEAGHAARLVLALVESHASSGSGQTPSQTTAQYAHHPGKARLCPWGLSCVAGCGLACLELRVQHPGVLDLVRGGGARIELVPSPSDRSSARRLVLLLGSLTNRIAASVAKRPMPGDHP